MIIPLVPAVSMNWDQAASPRAHKLDYDCLRDWQANATLKALDGDGIALRAAAGRAESMLLLA